MSTPIIKNNRRLSCCLGGAILLPVILMGLNLALNFAKYKITHYWQPGAYSLYVYTSTGDVNYDHRFNPQSSPAAVGLWMDRVANVQKVKRVFWRGSQDEGVLDNCILRPGDPVRFEHWDVWQRHLHRDMHINDVAVAAAHKNGLEIDAIDTLFDFGSPAWANFTRLPYTFEDHLRIEHPEWIPVDRTGKMRQAGPLEYAYPQVREVVSNRLVSMVQKHAYDGLVLYTYFENFDTRFTDEFGFNEPIVAEYKKRYGVDIRTQDFDRTKWAAIRGEYITEFLKQLHTKLKNNGKRLSICLSANNPDTMQEWPFETGQVNMRIRMDWRTWLKEGSVDQICIMGGGDNRGIDFANKLLAAGAKPSQISIFTERPFHYKFKGLCSPGVTLVGWSAPLPAQPMERYVMDEVAVDGIFSKDWHERAQGLAAISHNIALSNQVQTLCADPNLLVRREALRATRRVAAKLSQIEKALPDPESCVRTEAALAAEGFMSDGLIERLLVEVDRRPDWMFAEAVVEAITSSNSKDLPVLLEMLSNPSVAVRRVAARVASVKSPNALTLLRNALNKDTDPVVRYYALATLADLPSERVSAIKIGLSDKDATVYNQAVVLLKKHIGTIDAQDKTEAIRLLAEKFLQYGKISTLSDKDWGWRNIADTLLSAGKEGASVLEIALKSKDPVIAQHAYYGLYFPVKEHEYSPVTEAKAAEITRLFAPK